MKVDFSLGGLTNSSLSRARKSQLQSMTNMAAGYRRDLSRTDSGAYSLSLRVQSEKRFESGLSSTLQNAMSFAHTQSESLGQMQKILTKMSEIASLAGSVSSNASAKEIYQAQFDGLIEDFNNFANTKLNDVNVFGSVRTAEGEQFLDSLRNNWLKASEDLINDQYGWAPNPNDEWELIVDESGARGGWAAYVSSSWGADYKGDVQKMVFDLPDFNAPHTQPDSVADTTVAHEMVHALQTQNSYYGNLTGEGSPSNQTATWFKEGLAEFIAGADSRVEGDLWTLAGKPSSSRPASAPYRDASYVSALEAQVPTLLAKVGDGDGSWVNSDQYSAAFLAVRYLDFVCRSNGTGGIKHMTEWMRDQFKSNSGASSSGLNAYMNTFLGYTGGNDEFLADFKGMNGQNFVKGLVTSGKLFNDDTGSIRGSDALGPDGIVNEQDSVPDATGAPASKYTEPDDDSPDPIIVADGQTLTLNTIGTLNFGDSSTYDLTSENGAQLVVSRVEGLLGAIASNLGKIGSNMNAIETQTNLLSVRQVGMANKLENIQGVSIADESRTLSFSKILIDSNLSMRAQAMDIQRDATLMLLSA
jgi:flagellin